MEIKLAQRLSLGLNIVMTPQLQQAIRLLQLSRIELIDEVRRELESNPVLADDDSDPQERNEVEGSDGYVRRSSDQAMSDLDNHAVDRDINARREEKKVQEVDWEQFLENRTLQQPTYATRSGFEELPPIEQSLTRATSLADHLRWQLQMSDFTEAERAFVELVISNLDDNGFLDLKGSYQEEAEELEKEIERSPASKFAVLNLGVLQEKMGNHEGARRQFIRFLGEDCGADERAVVERVLKMVRRCNSGVDELIRDLVALPDSQTWARELLPRLKAKDARLRDLREVAAQAQRQAPKLGDGGKRVQSLLDAMDGLLHLQVPPMPEPLETLFRKAIALALDANFSEAAAVLERIPGLDVTPRERERVLQYLARLAENPEPAERPTSATSRKVDGEEDEGELPGARLTIEQMAERAGLDPEDALEVLRLVQNFDPIGVASRDLRECLRVQAEAYGYDELELAIIDRHLPNLEKHNYGAIARDLKVPLEEVYEACKWIQKLESRPARNFTDTDERSIGITPDVYIVKDGDKFVVLDNDRGLQRLYVNEALTKKLLHDPNAREWVGEKLKNAQWLIRAIEQRRKTIIRVTEAIVERQREFFEKGVAYLKPMILRDIAEEVHMHESTISRVTTNKYAHTPQGLFELKYFFNSAIRRADEEDIASESVKQAIKRLIETEDKQNPLSDQAIVDRLEQTDGIKIARRTVAKYREMMGILASSRRKKMF
ncbi:MAG: RNA polymerase factor sigma-54 [Myxococcales bacterium]|nr:RNA polymerase factor sigma-54 [Polyangiaceae bacterium]MDW8250439.1 RNA polymerase factor sigma-54 [Myxococcales bacterium]